MGTRPALEVARMEMALFGSLREVAGLSAFRVTTERGDTVRKVLERLFEAHPAMRQQLLEETGELRDHVSLFLRGRNLRLLQGLDTPIEDADRLAIFPPVAGG